MSNIVGGFCVLCKSPNYCERTGGCVEDLARLAQAKRAGLYGIIATPRVAPVSPNTECPACRGDGICRTCEGSGVFTNSADSHPPIAGSLTMTAAPPVFQISESYLTGYRLILGFTTLQEMQEFQDELQKRIRKS